jgi:Tfp pilus assembly protein PilN
MMRVLNFVSGVAVFFTTLAYGHLLEHHFSHAFAEDHQSPLFWLIMVGAAMVGILSLVGGFTLLKRTR